ncbi:MAG: alkaline phosphatase D family protein [Woeseiaceae bacterium]|nr:alkaline phosphatase D family protein [Woeseiaceae bacterium]
MKRRRFLGSLLGGALLPAAGCQHQPAGPGRVAFDHGVASGDPLADRVILWTRVSGITDDPVDVRWQVAQDAGFERIVRDGRFRTGPHRDYTVKVDVTGLTPGSRYFYRFSVDGRRSPVGRTRTLPAGPADSATFAVVSCSNHPYGYFNVYRDIAQQTDVDAVLHLGDYIYEYGMGEYATERADALGRVPQPSGRVVTLSDYRRRHAQYKADEDSQAMHAAHPLIAIWDDHELANDAWRGGAENHRDGEGTWPERRDAAIQAWLEWMPVRAAHARESTRIYRRYDYGDLLTLILLDTRLHGRDRQPDAGPGADGESIREALENPDRRLLGGEQEAWLRRTLQDTDGTTWQVVAQQVMLSPTRSPELEPLLDLSRESLLDVEQLQAYIEQSRGNPPMLLDTWNGYPAAREDFLADLDAHARNPVVLSGDLHTSLAGNLRRNGSDRPVAVEFMAPSVTSPGFAEYLPERRPNAVRDATLELNPSLVYMETDRRGWLQLTLDRDRCTGVWRLVDTVHERDYRTAVDARWRVRAGRIGDGLESLP